MNVSNLSMKPSIPAKLPSPNVAFLCLSLVLFLGKPTIVEVNNLKLVSVLTRSESLSSSLPSNIRPERGQIEKQFWQNCNHLICKVRLKDGWSYSTFMYIVISRCELLKIYGIFWMQWWFTIKTNGWNKRNHFRKYAHFLARLILY